MKVITLNTWGGRAGGEKLLSFFEWHKDDTDIFCLQEIWSAPYEHLDGSLAGGMAIDHEKIMVYAKQEISAAMTDYEVYFHPHHLDSYGLMMLVKKGIKVLSDGDVFVHKYRGYVPVGDVGRHARNIQYVTIKNQDQPITIINFHGLWNGKGKSDSPDRIIQSDNIVQFSQTLNNPFILCGDFNLSPNSQSLKKFTYAGLRNLIQDYGVTSTRTNYYTKAEKYADYVFVSEGISVINFQVLEDQVSDHSPLLLEFDIEHPLTALR